MKGEILVGICGDIGSGKDTTARHLMTRGFKKISVATALKETIASVLGVDRRYLYGSSPETEQAEKNEPIPYLGVVGSEFEMFGDPWPGRVGKPWTGRWVAEFVGECFRLIHDPVWIIIAMRLVERDRQLHHRNEGASEPFKKMVGGGHVLHVIPDVRYANEFTAIRATGGQVWEVVKLGHESERTGHVSDEEWRLEIPDARLEAETGDLDGLRRRADELIGMRHISSGPSR